MSNERMIKLCGIWLAIVSFSGFQLLPGQEFSGALQPSMGRPPQENSPQTQDNDAPKPASPLDFNELRRGTFADGPPTITPRSPAELSNQEQFLQPPSRQLQWDSAAAQPPRLSRENIPASFDDAEGTNTMQLDPATSDQSRNLVKSLLDSMGLAHLPDPLPGQPLALAEALRETNPLQRPAMVVQYWKTHNGLMRWHAAQQKVSRLESTIRPQTVVDQNLWNLSLHRSRCDAEQAAIELLRSQTTLQAFLPLSGNSDVYPLPADMPLVRGYETHFDWYAGQVSERRAALRGIDRALPRMHALITERAQAVQLADQSWRQSLQAYANGQTSLTSVLYSADAWHASLLEFAQAVADYNESIAEYSLTVAGVNLPPEQTAAMLIGTPSAFPVRQATHIHP